MRLTCHSADCGLPPDATSLTQKLPLLYTYFDSGYRGDNVTWSGVHAGDGGVGDVVTASLAVYDNKT